MMTSDLGFAVDLHRSSLGHGLFPSLGRRFLRAYLRTFIRSPFAVALVAEQSGDAVGFLVGTVDERRHYQNVIRRHGLGLALAGALALSMKPRLAATFVRTRLVRYVRGVARLARDTAPPAAPPVRALGADGVLTHLAVLPDWRGQGTGAALAMDFLSHARAGGASSLRLVTRDGESGAGPFYERLGWEPNGGFADADGTEWRRYRTTL